ncbi:hypothetical protein GIB67_021290 [Kingdonia uniflora]|uniref:Carboxypeptidase n=2 Tax=Magnoliopsida TaxID=3398 RepID=A0A7J7LY28_9MAGN|nr:hypothetical protein GIB67_021290 [Kingdonia uniflora]
MEKNSLLLPLFCALFLTPFFHGGLFASAFGVKDGSEQWGYIRVRPKAHMFWWLYKSPNRVNDPSKPWPIVLWLQGGPGASGVGIGNFEEVGPLDTFLNPRNSTWLQKTDLLFVDNPVGTGYSFVEDESALVKTDDEAALDLTTLLMKIFNRNKSLQNRVLYIVAESYGGKYAVTTALTALKAIESGMLKLKLGGVALGDSWISPEDFVLSWGPLLKDVSRLDNNGLAKSNRLARLIKQQLADGQFVEATNSWGQLEQVISDNSNNVDFYNFLLDNGMDPISTVSALQSTKGISLNRYSRYLNSRKFSPGGDGDLDTLMNDVIRRKLRIIPANVTWGSQSSQVFSSLEGDFMKPRIHEVDELLAKGVNVTVYNGQIDLICSTKGTEAWIQKLKWHGLKEFLSLDRTPLYCGNDTRTRGFTKSHKNLHFYWILGAGHFKLICFGGNVKAHIELIILQTLASWPILLWPQARYISAGHLASAFGTADGSEEWGYVEVRPKAHMFWWHYKSPYRVDDPSKPWPIILWLQGGPDSPVGTGYSYVEDVNLAVKTDEDAATDVTTLLKELFNGNKTLQESPLYIVAESYGGKFAVTLGLSALKAIEDGTLKLKFGGVALGDSWISPEDYVESWGPLLKTVSRINNGALTTSNSLVQEIRQQISGGLFEEATETWGELENVISNGSNDVDFYNFMLDSDSDPVSVVSALPTRMSTDISYSSYLDYRKSLSASSSAGLPALMNGVIRDKLKIIPAKVSWGGQDGIVFPAMAGDFMKPRIDEVDELLAIGVNVTVYNGQVDLICATPGTEAWIEKLKWGDLNKFLSMDRTPLYCDVSGGEHVTKAFTKSYMNFHFYWILGAGHFVPVDQPCMSLKMIGSITQSPN